MKYTEYMLAFSVTIFLFLWFTLLYNSLRGFKYIKKVNPNSKSEYSTTPLISLIIAIKDGEKYIHSTLKALAMVEYSALEVIIVNDRSVDETQNIINEFQKADERFKSLTVDSLPGGWLGKTHAMYQGAKIAKGDFFVFMDEDVVLKEKVLQLAISEMKSDNLKHLSLLPQCYSNNILLDLMYSTCKSFFIISLRPWIALKKKRTVHAKGVGWFNMVEANFFKTTEGFEWLQLEVADDVALAQLISKNNGRSDMRTVPPQYMQFEWYENFLEMIKGLEKNAFAGFTNYKISILVPLISMTSLTLIFPLYLVTQIPSLAASIGLSLWFTSLVAYAYRSKEYNEYKFIHQLLYPIGIFLLGLITLRSAIITIKNSGITWAGTHYPLSELKKKSVVKLSFF